MVAGKGLKPMKYFSMTSAVASYICAIVLRQYILLVNSHSPCNACMEQSKGIALCSISSLLIPKKRFWCHYYYDIWTIQCTKVSYLRHGLFFRTLPKVFGTKNTKCVHKPSSNESAEKVQNFQKVYKQDFFSHSQQSFQTDFFSHSQQSFQTTLKFIKSMLQSWHEFDEL